MINKKKKQIEDDFSAVPKSVEKSLPLKDDEEEKNSLNFKFILKCIIAGVIIGLVFAFIYIDTGVIGTYKKNFSANINILRETLGLPELPDFSNIFKSDKKEELKFSETVITSQLGSTYEQNSKMMPFENASSSKYAFSPRGLVVSKANYVAIFDENSDVVWNTQTSVISPILRAEGEYIVVAEEGGTKVCLYKDNTMLFSIDDENEIISASLSGNGDVVLVTKKEFYKNAVSVYNKNGEQIFSWSSGADTILSADISDSTRRVAMSLINTDERAKSYVLMFDINQKEPYVNLEFTESVVFKVQFIEEMLNVFSDNRVAGLNVSGDIKWDNVYEPHELVSAVTDKNGNKISVLDTQNIPKIVVFTKNGNEKESAAINTIPDYSDILENKVIFNSGRIVSFGKLNDLGTYIASMDIKGLKIINDNAFAIIYNNSLEFVKGK